MNTLLLIQLIAMFCAYLALIYIYNQSLYSKFHWSEFLLILIPIINIIFIFIAISIFIYKFNFKFPNILEKINNFLNKIFNEKFFKKFFFIKNK